MIMTNKYWGLGVAALVVALVAPFKGNTTDLAHCGASPGVMHSNGLGQQFSDCNPLGTYNYAQAMAAAVTWAQTFGGPAPEQGTCGPNPAIVNAVTVQAPNACAVWVYAGKSKGRVLLSSNKTCTCPFATDSNPQFWN